MDISIEKLKVAENKINEVTSEKVFKPRKIIDKNGNFLFHEDGIFSDKIFGKFNKCKCGALKRPGYCPICETRVISSKKIPDFYIKFDYLDIPYVKIEYKGEFKKEIQNILMYNGFLYDNEYIDLNLLDNDITKFDKSKILIGKEAALSLGLTEEEYNKNTFNKIFIPHPNKRRIIKTETGEYLLGKLNTIYIDILKQRNKLNQLYEKDYTKDNIIYELKIKKIIIEKIYEIYEELFIILAKNRNNIIAKELRGQEVTGIIRAVVTNNFSLDEDIALVGNYFIPYLYPKLYRQFTENGITNIEAINEHIINHQYICLLNRQPTIGAKSILGIIPQFSTIPDEKYVMQLNPIIMDGLAGDFDGDTLSLTALYSKAACSEAFKLLPSKNYIEGANSSIRNGLPEDFQYVLQKLQSEE